MLFKTILKHFDTFGLFIEGEIIFKENHIPLLLSGDTCHFIWQGECTQVSAPTKKPETFKNPDCNIWNERVGRRPSADSEIIAEIW